MVLHVYLAIHISSFYVVLDSPYLFVGLQLKAGHNIGNSVAS